MGKEKVFGTIRVQLPYWEYISGETITPAGASTAVTIPSSARSFIVSAEGGAAYYAINAAFATAASPGYVPGGGSATVGPLSNLNTLHVWAAAGVTVHIMFFREM